MISVRFVLGEKVVNNCEIMINNYEFMMNNYEIMMNNYEIMMNNYEIIANCGKIIVNYGENMEDKLLGFNKLLTSISAFNILQQIARWWQSF